MAQNLGVILDSDDVREAYENVRNDLHESNWLCLGYDDKSIILKATGKDYDELCKIFTDDERYYAYYRMTIGDEMSVRAKFVLFTWIGPAVSPMKKAKVSTDKAFVKEIIQIFSLEVLADDKSDLTEAKVKKTIELSSGAK